MKLSMGSQVSSMGGKPFHRTRYLGGASEPVSYRLIKNMTITELKHVLTRLITERYIENTLLYVVLRNMLN